MMKKMFAIGLAKPVTMSFFMLLVIGVICNAQIKNASVTPPDTQIATAKGQEITYGEIRVTSAERAAYNAYGGEKLPKEAFINQTELQNLAGKINDIIIPYLRTVFHINITNEDIRNHRTEIKDELNMDQSLSDLQRKTGKLLTALESVYEENMDRDIAYDKYLRDSYSQEMWHRMLKNYYPNQKSYQTLKKQYQKSFLITQKQKNAILDEQVVKILQMRELTSAVLKELSTKDSIVKTDIAKLLKDPSDNEVKMRLRKRYQEWWKDKYKELVKVYDPKYNSVFELLKDSAVFYPSFKNNKSSQVKPPSHPKNAQSSHNGAPPIKTTVFNQKNIEELIANIDNPQNVMLLKFGYFAGHKKHPFVTGDGFIWLTDALEKTKVGTLRWFLIQSVRGFGAFHAQDVLNDYGRDAYQGIFDNADLAKAPKEKYVVRQSIQDMVFCIGTTLDTDLFLHEPKLSALLFKAWRVNQQLKANVSTQVRSQSIDWGRAIERVHAQDKFTAIVEDALKDTAHPPNFQMLKLAVVVLQDAEPKRAIELLQTAQTKMQYGNKTQQKWLYETWTQLITSQDPNDQLAPKITDKTQLADLAAMRKDQISYTGTGYAELLKLYWQLGQYDKANDLIFVAKGSGIRASQKIDVAKVLLRPSRDLQFSKETTAQLQEQGVALLQGYLMSLQENPPKSPFKKGDLGGGSTEKRDFLDEVRARYELGRYFIKEDQITEALQALDIGDLKPTSRHTRASMYYDQIIKMKAELAAKLKDVEGVQ